MKKLLAISAILLIISCSTENESTNFESVKDESLIPNEFTSIPDSLQYLKDYLIDGLKFQEEDIKFDNQEFILENDMTITVDGLLSLIEFNKENGIDPAAHYASTGCGLYSPIRASFCPGRNCSHDDEVYRIAVDINNSVPSAWRQATINAMNNWNNLPNNRITFFLTDRSCDIRAWHGIDVFLFSDGNTSILARAALAYGRDPGYRIRINTNSTSYSINDIPFFTRVMTHELGHNLGYRHTDETSGCFISGSAATDNGSIMNSSTFPGSPFVGQGFSNADRAAHDLLYPNANSGARTVEFNCSI